MDRLEQLLDKANKTEEEEVELDRLLKEHAKEHDITYDPEYGYQ